MINWQVTAATLYCDAIDGEVTVLVYKDGSVRCVAYQKYTGSEKETAKHTEQKSKPLDRPLKCEGPECRLVIQYRDKLFAEETGEGEKAGR